MLAHPQLLHPILYSPTSPIFKTLSNLICIQNTVCDRLGYANSKTGYKGYKGKKASVKTFDC
eukprot:537217-Pelagomonas_calceolata.AAC.1